MSVNDDGLGPASDSFWEVDGYKSTVRRQEDGAKLCTDLMALIQERADIEKSYSKSLLAWNKKWMTSIDKGPEYGTTQAAWKAVLVESESIAQIHSDIRDQLLNEVQHKIKEWKAANFKKAMMGACKETKQLEDEFKKAQKPWAKKYHKVKEARKNYHHACKAEKSTTNLENNSRADSSLSPDQISLASFHTSTREIDDDGKRVRKMKKLADKAEKCRKEVESTEQKYQSALTDLNSYNPKYMEDMTMVFEKSDNNEEKRLVFFKEMLFGIHKCLDISQNPKIPQTYSQLHYTIDQADYQKDLKWWSQTRGKDMGMGWPQFEEYREGHHAISRKEKTRSTHIGGNEGITLTGLRTDNATNPPPPSYNNATMATSMTDANGGSTGATPQASPNLQSQNQNPFGDDDFEEEEETLDTSNGTPVRAIYDYSGQEDDELTFKEGDVFLKLKDKDAQGWCTGMKDGTVGLYPDNYATPV